MNIIIERKKSEINPEWLFKSNKKMYAGYVYPMKDILMNILKCKETGKRKIRIHPCYWKGPKKRMKLVDNFDEFRSIAEAFNIAYNVGNDAPRGGAAGTYIEYLIDFRELGCCRLLAVAQTFGFDNNNMRLEDFNYD